MEETFSVFQIKVELYLHPHANKQVLSSCTIGRGQHYLIFFCVPLNTFFSVKFSILL